MVRKVKSPQAKLKAKADKLAGDHVRARGYCQLGGADHVTCNGNLQWAHIVGRSNHRLRWEEYNALCLCAGHHMWYTYHPYEWVRIIDQEFPEYAAEIEKHRNEIWDKDINAVIRRYE